MAVGEKDYTIVIIWWKTVAGEEVEGERKDKGKNPIPIRMHYKK